MNGINYRVFVFEAYCFFFNHQVSQKIIDNSILNKTTSMGEPYFTTESSCIAGHCYQNMLNYVAKPKHMTVSIR